MASYIFKVQRSHSGFNLKQKQQVPIKKKQISSIITREAILYSWWKKNIRKKLFLFYIIMCFTVQKIAEEQGTLVSYLPEYQEECQIYHEGMIVN
jgi:hypothetical protein